MWRQAIDGVKIKAASWMALEKQRVRVCEAAKDYKEKRTEENEVALLNAVKRLEAMESIQ